MSNESVAKCWVSTEKILNQKEYIITLTHGGLQHEMSAPQNQRQNLSKPSIIWQLEHRSF